MNRGCCTALHLRADNARFLLLAVFMMVYMLSGAALFMWLEHDNEQRLKEKYNQILGDFRLLYPMVNSSDLNVLLRVHGEAYSSGLLADKRQRWDFAGSFYFVGTVVSTIGFGMTTPKTLPGKIVLIAYGFLGCAGGILFFNLFLERIITFWAFILRSIHNARLRRKLAANAANSGDDSSGGRDRRDSCVTDEDSLDQWKPSVYKVQFLLLVTAIGIASCASAVYHPVERWSYFDAIYFCFVTFATIGFGDYVVSQHAEYPAVHWYRFANFFFILLGCCCIYSFFNVTSLVIRSFLDVVIRKLNIDCSCCRRGSRASAMRAKPYLGRSRRNAITADHFADMAKNAVKRHSFDSNYDSNGDSRYSDEMISMQDFLQTNKVALAMIQKQLYETAQRSRGLHSSDALQGGVGPLAIVDHKFGQEELC